MRFKNFLSGFGIFITFTTACCFMIGTRKTADAVPAYARQFGVSCEQCHTIWPHLNAFGRRFKVKGYVDKSKNPGVPIALRVITKAETTTNNSGVDPSPAGTINFPDEVNFFIGAALSPRLGTFVEVTAAREIDENGGATYPIALDHLKFAYNLEKGKPESIVLSKSNMLSMDPYDSLDVDRPAFSGDLGVPGFMADGYLISPLDDNNSGLGVHGFFGPDQHWYASFGLQTGGLPGDTGTAAGITVTPENEPWDYMGRVAYEGPLGENGGDFHVGAAYYAGTQNPYLVLGDESITRVRSGVERFFVDGSIQVPVRENDVFEVLGLFSKGMDHSVTEVDPDTGELAAPFDAAVNGVFLQADYYWNKRIGLLALYDHSDIAPTITDRWALGAAWLPAKDFKIILQGGPSQDNGGNRSSTTQLVFTKYF